MTTEEQGAQPVDDLVDRWLAHRERTAEDPATRPRTYGITRTHPSGRPVRPAGPALPVEDALPGEDAQHVETVEPGGPTEPTPVAAEVASEVGIDLGGFEPVLTASARRALEQPQQRRAWRGRRGRDDATATDDAPAEDDGADRGEDPPGPETPETETAVAAPAPPDHVGAGRDILATLGTAAPAPERLPEPGPEPEPEPEPQPAPELRAEPESRRDPEPEPGPAPPPRLPSPRPTPTPRTPRRTTRVGPLASSLRAGVARAISGAPEPEAPAAPLAAPPAAPPLRTTPTRPADALPTELHSPGGTRAAAGLVLLLGLVATGVAGYVAYRDPTETAWGVTGVLGLLSAIVWAVRASASRTRMTLHAGRLEIQSAAGRHVFDLANPHTPIEVRGRPGSRGWKVLFHRRAMAPFVVDSSMVDAAAFTDVLLHHRPDLGATASSDHAR